jgi:hypothetical protein
MEGMLAKDSFALLAPVIKDPVDAGVNALKALETSCEHVIASGGGQISHDVKTIAVYVCDLKRCCMLASQVLATMSKATVR